MNVDILDTRLLPIQACDYSMPIVHAPVGPFGLIWVGRNRRAGSKAGDGWGSNSGVGQQDTVLLLDPAEPVGTGCWCWERGGMASYWWRKESRRPGSPDDRR